MIDLEEEERRIFEAVKVALVSWRSEHTEPPAGLALCTDDNLSTLFAVVVTASEVEGAEEPNVLFFPSEWPHELDSPGLGDASIRFNRMSQSHTVPLHTYVDSAFGVLVAALARCRQERLVHDDALLIVMSTDPSDPLEVLARQAAITLNTEQVAAGWIDANQ